MGSTFFLGFSYTNLLLVFLKILSKKSRFWTRFCSHKNRPKGGGIASSFILFSYLLYWYYSYIVYFVCAPASEFGAMGSISFLGFSYPNLLLVFLNLLFFRNLYHIFLAASVGTLSESFLFYRYFSAPYFGLA